MTTKLAGQEHPLPPVQPRARRAVQGIHPTPAGTAPPTCGSGCGLGTPGWTSSPGSSMSSGPSPGSAAAKKAAETVIFPRYHQWDAVLKLEADAKANGAGKSYLVQHSAGSGKSNTIAWTAHRLSNLHDATDTKVFDKVVVITDRVVLDRQLQDTIYQFEHAQGVVVKIDQNSQQLADALAGEQARIIITTLQKFPFVLDKIGGLPQRRYAVIVDEAHSSQTGEAAKDLRRGPRARPTSRS